MEDRIFSLNDVSSSGTNKDKQSAWKKYLIPMIIIFSIIIIILIIVIVVLALNSSNEKKDEPQEKEKDKDIEKKIYGIIKAIYDIQTKKTIILGDEFKKKIDFDIFIDNEKINYTKEYTFSSTGVHLVEYKLYQKSINIDYMFKDITSLILIEMSSDSQIYIESMSQSFENCINLDKFESNKFNTTLIKSFHKLFYNTGLNSFKIDNYFDTSNIVDMSYMFSGSRLTSIDLSIFQLNNTQNLSNIFSNCNSLLNINAKDINTSNVKDLSFMFYKCESILSMDLSSFDTSKVTNMANMFKECISLKTLDISSFNTRNVEDMSNMFENCNSLNNLNILNFDIINVKNMSYMFHLCNSLSEINLTNFKANNVKDISHMFDGCYTLSSLNLNNFDTKNIVDMSYLFNDCNQLIELDLSNFITN